MNPRIPHYRRWRGNRGVEVSQAYEAQYVVMKQEWDRENPEADPAERDLAIMRITKMLGV